MQEEIPINVGEDVTNALLCQNLDGFTKAMSMAGSVTYVDCCLTHMLKEHDIRKQSTGKCQKIVKRISDQLISWNVHVFLV